VASNHKHGIEQEPRMRSPAPLRPKQYERSFGKFTQVMVLLLTTIRVQESLTEHQGIRILPWLMVRQVLPVGNMQGVWHVLVAT
jgi:hypothetical protein